MKNRSQVAGRRSQVAGRRLQRLGKRGMISNFIAFFGATIAIVLILTVYVIGGVVIGGLDKSAAKVSVYDEREVEIDNVFGYSERYVMLSEVRALVAGGMDVDMAIAQVNRKVEEKVELENLERLEEVQHIR